MANFTLPYCEDYLKPINTLREQNAILFHVKASDTRFKGLPLG
jgi:hypothetical protein